LTLRVPGGAASAPPRGAGSPLAALAFAVMRGALAEGSGCELTEQACCW
jgi:hypothetical protein